MLESRGEGTAKFNTTGVRRRASIRRETGQGGQPGGSYCCSSAAHASTDTDMQRTERRMNQGQAPKSAGYSREMTPGTGAPAATRVALSGQSVHKGCVSARDVAACRSWRHANEGMHFPKVDGTTGGRWYRDGQLWSCLVRPRKVVNYFPGTWYGNNTNTGRNYCF